MIHLHLTLDEAAIVGEGLGRLIAEGEANVTGDHMTPVAKQKLRAHIQGLRVIKERLLVKRPPAKPKAAKVDRCSQANLVESGFAP